MQRLFCKKKLMSALGLMLGVVLIFAAPALAGYSTPEGAPSWWGAEDDFTVSLSWYFDRDPNPQFDAVTSSPVPDFKVVPDWYEGETWTIDGPQWYASVAGREGVWGYDGSDPDYQFGQWDVMVDNQEREPLKHVWYQIDYYLSSGDAWIDHGVSVPAGFDILDMLVTDEEIADGGGWRRLTVSLDIVPQPYYELFWHDIMTMPGGIAVIDQLHVSTQCVPEPASLLLLGIGLLGLAGKNRKRKNRGVSSIV